MLFFLPRSPMVGGLLVAGVLVLGGTIWQSGKVPGAIRERLASVVEELAIVEDARGAELTADNYAVVERVAHWQAATQMAEEHPWIGVGFGNYEVAYPSYRLIDWPMALGHAHNYYLNLLAETGIVGLLGYLIAWIWIFVISMGIWRRSQGLVRAWSIALLGIWVYIAVHSVVDKLYVNNLFMNLGVLLGFTAILHQALPPGTSASHKGG
jgi:O-antigen ligase